MRRTVFHGSGWGGQIKRNWATFLYWKRSGCVEIEDPIFLKQLQAVEDKVDSLEWDEDDSDHVRNWHQALRLPLKQHVSHLDDAVWDHDFDEDDDDDDDDY